ncbi:MULTISPECIES: LacI family DNA-binding transcriptional regulator [unclassified Streptomyces]|uniref:LacI family DNA-binding transcriptional regulator n=1 Tax=unclassified Streptomyces TaxID=2593676 RepID=UPI002E207A28|nr:LacI family transcriptional regulator [Streptomyces sp. NBC_01023]
MSPAQRRPTSADVARLAGVSRTTVSSVINDDRERPISEETRRRVLAAVHELGYTPHASARMLRAGRSTIVLFPMPRLPLGSARATYLEILDRELAARGLTLLIHGDREAGGLSGARLWAEHRPAAVLVEADRCPEEAVGLLRRAGVDQVLLEARRPLPYAPTIVIDGVSVAELAAQYLVDRGHRRFACLVPGGVIAGLARDRFEAVTTVAGRAGIPVQRVDCALTTDSLAATAGLWRDPARRPDAVYAYNDEYALVLIQALTDAGLRVPEDIAVIGTDNHPLGAALRPALTTTYLDPVEGAAAVASAIERLLDGGELAPGLAEIARPRIITRHSA